MFYGAITELVTPVGSIFFNQPSAAGGTLLLTGQQNLGSPQVRRSYDPAPQRDGAISFDAYYGARAIVLEGTVAAEPEDAQVLVDDMLAKVTSLLRSTGTLKMTPPGQAGRQMTVCLADVVPFSGDTIKTFQLPLLAADPWMYSQLERFGTLDASGDDSAGSWSFPFLFPFSFGNVSTATTNVLNVANAGNVTSYPVIRLDGFLTDPVVYNLTTGEQLNLTGLSISDGEYIEIDTVHRTVLLNGSKTASRVAFLDVATSTFWGLAPGNNDIRLTATDFSGGGGVTVIWRDAWA